MDEERLPQKILTWCPSGRRRKGRPRNSWMPKVTTEMREKGINSMEWIDFSQIFPMQEKSKQSKSLNFEHKITTLITLHASYFINFIR